jgi:hypothetical protein
MATSLGDLNLIPFPTAFHVPAGCTTLQTNFFLLIEALKARYRALTKPSAKMSSSVLGVNNPSLIIYYKESFNLFYNISDIDLAVAT